MLVGGYIVASQISQALRRTSKDTLSVTGDAVRFSQSVLIILAMLYPIPVLVAIGNFGPFLLYAGVAGLYHALRALFR